MQFMFPFCRSCHQFVATCFMCHRVFLLFCGREQGSDSLKTSCGFHCFSAPRGTFLSTSGLSFAQPYTGLSTWKETAPIVCTTHQSESSKSKKHFSPGTNCEMYLKLKFLLITTDICKPPAGGCHIAHKWHHLCRQQQGVLNCNVGRGGEPLCLL